MNNMQKIKSELFKKLLSTKKIEIFEIKTSDFCFEQRVELKCFYCSNYNKKWTCPPKIPKVDYKTIIQNEYKEGLIIRYSEEITKETFQEVRLRTTNMLHKILLDAEKFLYDRNVIMVLSFIGGSCKLCKNNCNPQKCNNPQLARIPMEATGINVVKTLKKINIDVDFPIENNLSRYGLLLWEEC